MFRVLNDRVTEPRHKARSQFKTTAQSVGFFNYYCSMVPTWCSVSSWMTISQSRGTKPGASLKRQQKSVGFFTYSCSMVPTWCSWSWKTMSQSRGTKPWANLKRQQKAWASFWHKASSQFKTTAPSVGFFNYYCSMVPTWCSGSWMTISQSSGTKPGANLKRQHKAWASLLILVLWYPPDVPGPGWPCRKAAAQSPPRPSWTPRSHQLNREKRTRICFKRVFQESPAFLYNCRAKKLKIYRGLQVSDGTVSKDA